MVLPDTMAMRVAVGVRGNEGYRVTTNAWTCWVRGVGLCRPGTGSWSGGSSLLGEVFDTLFQPVDHGSFLLELLCQLGQCIRHSSERGPVSCGSGC